MGDRRGVEPGRYGRPLSDMIDGRICHGASRCLEAAFNELIPPDESSGGWSGGVRTYLEHELDKDLSWACDALRNSVDELDTAARERDGSDFADLSRAGRRAVLACHLEEDLGGSGSHPLVRIAMEGYYAARTPGLHDNWRSIGFVNADTSGAPELPPSVALAAIKPGYDTVVIGAGAGGGVLAGVLAEAGQRVLLIERGPSMSDPELRGDHLHGKRLAVYDVNVGPGSGHPRVIELEDGTFATVEGDSDPWVWGLNAICLGGGTRLWQGMAWRFLPDDFAMATRYGVPHDGTLADWPITYDRPRALLRAR